MVNQPAHQPVYALLLASAQQDLAACKLLACSAGIGDAMVGFHAQQSIEKSLKAVLSAHRIEFRRTHDLISLLDLLQDHKQPHPPRRGCWHNNGACPSANSTLPPTTSANRAAACTEFVNDFETPECINLVCNRVVFC